jgi:hypothetical protein
MESQACRQTHQVARPKHLTWNPRKGEQSDILRYTTKEPQNVTTQYAISNQAAKLHPTQGSREVTPSSGKEAPSDVAVHHTKEGTKGGKKMHK